MNLFQNKNLKSNMKNQQMKTTNLSFSNYAGFFATPSCSCVSAIEVIVTKLYHEISNIILRDYPEMTYLASTPTE